MKVFEFASTMGIFKCHDDEKCYCGKPALVWFTDRININGYDDYTDRYMCEDCLKKYTNYFEIKK